MHYPKGSAALQPGARILGPRIFPKYIALQRQLGEKKEKAGRRSHKSAELIDFEAKVGTAESSMGPYEPGKEKEEERLPVSPRGSPTRVPGAPDVGPCRATKSRKRARGRSFFKGIQGDGPVLGLLCKAVWIPDDEGKRKTSLYSMTREHERAPKCLYCTYSSRSCSLLLFYVVPFSVYTT